MALCAGVAEQGGVGGVGEVLRAVGPGVRRAAGGAGPAPAGAGRRGAAPAGRAQGPSAPNAAAPQERAAASRARARTGNVLCSLIHPIIMFLSTYTFHYK